MEDVNCCQVVELTEQEKRDLYMSLDKEYLVEMILTNQILVRKLLDALGEQISFGIYDTRQS